MSFGTQTHRPIAQLQSVKTAVVHNIVSPVIADEEFSFIIPNSTKRILFRSRDKVDVKFNFESIDIASKWITLTAMSSYSDWGLELNDTTIFFKINLSSSVIEVMTWS